MKGKFTSAGSNTLACWVAVVTGVACAILLYTNVIYLKNLFFVRFSAEYVDNVSQRDEALEGIGHTDHVDPAKMVSVLEMDAEMSEMKDFSADI